jgi:altronate dehydratase large subunit
MTFLGFQRPNGLVGTRNYVGIISEVACANDVAWWVAQKVTGSAVFLHGQGCAQTKPDNDRVQNTLVNLGWNPNLAAVLIVSLGCESLIVDEVAQAIAKSGKPVEKLVIQKSGGAINALAKGIQIAGSLAVQASKSKREEFPDSYLKLGVKCGASDTLSGLTSNPAAGAACDILIDNGGTCIFGETTEFMGAEHILCARAATPAVGQKIVDAVARMENRARASGFDMRGGQPTTGNIAGGLTTIEEKSLGAISKGGTRPIRDFHEYGERITEKGLHIMDSPGREPEMLTGLAATGAQVMVFSTGLGAPQGFPFVPVIKITGNPNTYRNLGDHIDQFVEFTEESGPGVQAAGKKLYNEIISVASGKQTKAEMMGYGIFTNIYTTGPVI